MTSAHYSSKIPIISFKKKKLSKLERETNSWGEGEKEIERGGERERQSETHTTGHSRSCPRLYCSLEARDPTQRRPMVTVAGRAHRCRSRLTQPSTTQGPSPLPLAGHRERERDGRGPMVMAATGCCCHSPLDARHSLIACACVILVRFILN